MCNSSQGNKEGPTKAGSVILYWAPGIVLLTAALARGLAPLSCCTYRPAAEAEKGLPVDACSGGRKR